MTEPITEEALVHVARLARLEVTAEEAAQLAHELAHILEHAARLADLDLDEVEPMAHAHELVGALRDDTPGAPLSTDEALANAPGTEPPFFRVPKVLGGTEGA